MNMAAPVFYSVQLIEKQAVAREIVILRFTKPAGFSFVPGQFVQVRVPEGERFIMRSFSLSSAPSDNHLELCVKILPDGKASALFDKLSPGGVVEISEARGVFVVQSEHSTRKVFIATGTGIAPIMSMLRGSLHPTDAAQLLFGVRSEENLFWAERFEAVRTNHPRFEYLITLSKPSPAWEGKRGRVIDHLGLADLAASYYICGNVDMVKDVRARLLAQGLNTKSIHIEIF